MKTAPLHLIADPAHSLLWLVLKTPPTCGFHIELHRDALDQLSSDLHGLGATPWEPIPLDELLPGQRGVWVCSVAQVETRDLPILRAFFAESLEAACGATVTLWPNGAATALEWSLTSPTWRAWRRAFIAQLRFRSERDGLEQAATWAEYACERERDARLTLEAQLREAEAHLRSCHTQPLPLTPPRCALH